MNRGAAAGVRPDLLGDLRRPVPGLRGDLGLAEANRTSLVSVTVTVLSSRVSLSVASRDSTVSRMVSTADWRRVTTWLVFAG
ncbi:hypothetical protein [Nonomuraea insulae]|uniref:Uncharacterized protein n=1 Tax=Nonomuraea insulae TaxID=1616787 RepID=A0ABW1CL52_9ACTN